MVRVVSPARQLEAGWATARLLRDNLEDLLIDGAPNGVPGYKLCQVERGPFLSHTNAQGQPVLETDFHLKWEN